MTSGDFWDFVKKAAPWIGAAATGNVPALITMAADAVSQATGKPVDPTAQAVHDAIAHASPEDLLKIKQADDVLASQLQIAGFKDIETLESIAAGDRDSARKREISVRDNVPALLAAFAVLSMVCVLVAILAGVEPSQSMRDAFMLALGALIATFKDVFGYYFGSSAGSADKNAIIKAQAGQGAGNG